jgi:hypothetical protein
MSSSPDSKLPPEPINSASESEEQVEEIVIDRHELDQMVTYLNNAIADGIKTGIKRGLLHRPASDRHLLLVAANIVKKSQKFPNYKLTFYHEGMGKDTNTCAVTFVEI